MSNLQKLLLTVLSGGGILAPALTVTPPAAFGTTEGLVTVDKSGNIANTGNAALTGVNITVPTGFTVTVQPSATIAAGANSDFTVRATAAAWGVFSGNITIESNELPDYLIPISVTVTLITTGLVRDWDFSDTSKLYESTDTSDPAEADDALGLVVGQVTGNLGQSTLAQRPLRKDAIQNSKTVARFDATDFMSLSTTLTNTGNETIFVVCKHGTTGAFGRILGITGTTWGILYSSIANRVDYDYNGATATKSGGFTETNFVIIAARYNGTNNIVRVNGLLGATSGSPAAASHTWNTVAARGGGNDPLNGDIGRMLIYNVSLSDAQVAFTEAALSTIWGVSI